MLSVLLFALVIVCLFLGMDSLNKKTLSEQKSSLEKALHRSAVECYATEGAYPESLIYLEQYYSLSYNKETFFVDYQPIGENIMPEITVIIKVGD